MSEEVFVPASISLKPEEITLLDRIAKDLGKSRSSVVREALTDYYRKSLQNQAPLAGVVKDSDGNTVASGIVNDFIKAKISTGEYRLVTEF